MSGSSTASWRFSSEAARRFGDIDWWFETDDDSGLTEREKAEKMAQATLIRSGIQKNLECGEWKDLDRVNREIRQTLDDCKRDLDNNLDDYGWTGIMLWYAHLWTKDYLLRAQALVLCAMRNNLDSKYDAEWYLAVLQENVINVVADIKFGIFHPVSNITLAVLTVTLWFWFMVIWALIYQAAWGAQLYGYCSDVQGSLGALDKDGGDFGGFGIEGA